MTESRDAYVGRIRAPHKNALPAIGASGVAGFGTDLIAHVGGANARVAIVRTVAAFAEAPCPWFAFWSRNVGLCRFANVI